MATPKGIYICAPASLCDLRDADRSRGHDRRGAARRPMRWQAAFVAAGDRSGCRQLARKSTIESDPNDSGDAAMSQFALMMLREILQEVSDAALIFRRNRSIVIG